MQRRVSLCEIANALGELSARSKLSGNGKCHPASDSLGGLFSLTRLYE